MTYLTPVNGVAYQSIGASLSQLGSQFIAAIPSIILFIIIVLIGYAIAVIVSRVIGRVMSGVVKHAGVQLSAGLVAGTVKALIVLISLAIAFSVLNLGAANVYVGYIVRYLPALAGAILLLTLGLALVDLLVNFMQQRMGVDEDDFIKTVLVVLRFGLYAVIITVAANLAIFYWIPSVSSYLFYDIIIGSIILLFSFSITERAINEISKAHPEMGGVLGYARLILYTVFILVAIAIIVQPFANVTAIIYALSWGLAIAFAIVVIPLAYSLVKKVSQ
jgi:hypothetical protein